MAEATPLAATPAWTLGQIVRQQGVCDAEGHVTLGTHAMQGAVLVIGSQPAFFISVISASVDNEEIGRVSICIYY